MAFLSLLAILIVLNIIYVIGFLGAQVLTKSPKRYFLGFNPGLIPFSLNGVKFNLGLYIPIIGLARIYCIDDRGAKQLFYPWQASKTSVLKRLLLTYSGVLALIVFGVILSIVGAYTSKDQYISKEQVLKHGIYPSPQARTVGFLPGDKITSVNGMDYSDFYELVHPEVIQSEQTNYTILRKGEEMTISLAANTVPTLPRHELFLTINSPFSIGKVSPESPAEKAGILSGDRIVKVNNHPITSFQEMNFYFESDDDGEVTVEILRGSAGQQTFQKTVSLNEYNKIGVSIEQMIEYKIKEHSFLESLKLGPVRFWSNTAVQFKVFAKTIGLFAGQEKETLSGPIGISTAFGSFSFPRLVSFTSLYISFVIMLNLLPLPKSAMLEVIPLGYEAVSRKPFSYQLFRRIRQISIVLLVALVILQLVSDIIKLF
jgi:regulator of sigma E protease